MQLVGYLLLLLSVNSFLLGSEDLHTFHELSEIAFHGRQAGTQDGFQDPSSFSHSHDCHNCLVAHPGASASTPLQRKLRLPGESNTFLNLEWLIPQSSRLFTGIHNRAPPR